MEQDKLVDVTREGFEQVSESIDALCWRMAGMEARIKQEFHRAVLIATLKLIGFGVLVCAVTWFVARS